MAVNFGFGNNTKESVQEIPSNRTLIIQKLTDLPPLKPEVVSSLNTPKAVFQYFRPKVHVVFDNLEKGQIKETITFEDIFSFEAGEIATRSKFLSEVKYKESVYFDILKALQSHKALQEVVVDDSSKEILLQKIKELKKELK